jgi:hypothetical protein
METFILGKTTLIRVKAISHLQLEAATIKFHMLNGEVIGSKYDSPKEAESVFVKLCDKINQ